MKFRLILLTLLTIILVAGLILFSGCEEFFIGVGDYFMDKIAPESDEFGNPEFNSGLLEKETREQLDEALSEAEEEIKEEKKDQNSISLKGKVDSPIPGALELNIDDETGTVEGSIKGMGWTEEVFSSNEPDDCEDHFHSVECEVIFNGTFFGKIDKNGIIFANVTGYISSRYGECSQLVKDKPESFTLSGTYYKDYNNAGGSLPPKGYSWNADRI